MKRNDLQVWALIVILFLMLVVNVTTQLLPRLQLQKETPSKKHAIGYTVLDSNRVITCCGDTVDYDYKQNIRYKQPL